MIKQLTFVHGARLLATSDELRRFEAEFHIRLQPTFVEFCLEYNGGVPEAANNFYEVPDSFLEFHEEYSDSDGVMGILVNRLYGLTDQPYSCDIRQALCKFRRELRDPLFPIASDLLGNSVVIRDDRSKDTVWWRDHELWRDDGSPLLFPISRNLEAFYNALGLDPAPEE